MSRCVPSSRSRGRHIRTVVASVAAMALVGPVGAASAQSAIDNGYGNPGTGKQIILPNSPSGTPTPTPTPTPPGSPPVAVHEPVAVSAGSSNGVGTLPFTGLDLAPLLLVGLGVLGLGIGLRRMTSRTAPRA